MAVGHERAHAELGGQGQGLAVVPSAVVHSGRIAMRGDLTQEAEGLTPRVRAPRSRASVRACSAR